MADIDWNRIFFVCEECLYRALSAGFRAGNFTETIGTNKDGTPRTTEKLGYKCPFCGGRGRAEVWEENVWWWRL